MGVPVIDADGTADAILVVLGAPTAAKRPEIADEELGCLRINAVKLRRQQIGMMTGDDPVRNSLGERLEHGVDDGHRKRIHQRIGAGRVALITRPGGTIDFRLRNEPSLIG